MIHLRKIADLDLSAASGLVVDGPRVYVVADDEHFLDGYSLETGRRSLRIALPFEGELPADESERKRLKPDLESLAWLPDRRLVALGSGSTPRRERGVVLAASRTMDGAPTDPRLIDLSPLYAFLRLRLGQLNIEGAAVLGDGFRLFQRGNTRTGENAIIQLDLARTVRSLESGEPLTGELVVDVRTVDLGHLEGVPLGFTDASPFDPDPTRIAFVAAAEATDDPYEDAPCAGSVFGVLDREGRVEFIERIEGRHKVEGLSVTADGRLLFVADPDSRHEKAPLFEGRVAHGSSAA